MKKKLTRVAALTAILCFAVSAVSCGDDPGKIVFPLNDLPDVLTENCSSELEIYDISEYSNAVSDNAQINPNAVLLNDSIDVYYDNTTGCFMEYVNMNKADPYNIAYQMFSKTMKSFKETFESAGTYSTYTIQTEKDNVLLWKEYAEDVFLNYGNIDTYTYNTGGIFLDDTSPINMWVEQLKSDVSDKKKINVYISDFNEQNGLLSKSGKNLKELLDSNPDCDLLIISYVLPFKGTISSPTLKNEGDGKSQVESKEFKDTVDRNFYAAAFGDRESLSALSNVIKQKFGEIGLNMDTFMYRTSCYTEKIGETVNCKGEKISSDYTETSPPLLSILNSDGNAVNIGNTEEDAAEVIEDEKEEKGDIEEELLGGKDKEGKKSKSGSSADAISENIELCNDYSEYLALKPNGYTYIFKSIVPDIGGKNAEFAMKLDNSDIYSLDMDNATVCSYNSKTASSLEGGENIEKWVYDADLSKLGVQVIFEEDTVKIKMSDCLSSKETVIISIPVKFSYSQNTVTRDIMFISDEYADFAERCKVPDIITEENENERFTKTYGFDNFIDKLTGYKSIVNSGQNQLVLNEVSETNDLDMTVGKLNIIIVPDKKNK